MQIGEIARRSGFSIDTLRYYEKIGLMPRVNRDEGGRRQYDGEDLARLRFICRAQRLKLSLDEIGQLLTLRERPEAARQEAQVLSEHKLAEIEHHLGELQALKAELSTLLQRCRSSTGKCPILDHMQHDSSAA